MRKLREPDVRLRPVHIKPHADNHDGYRDAGVQIVRESVPARAPSGETARTGGAEKQVPAPPRLPLGSAARVAFGLIWLADVYFKWQPSFLNGLPDVMRDGAMGQPGWLQPWFNFSRAVIAIQPTAWAYVIAFVETAIALAVLLGFARKVTYIGGALWSLLVWATAEGFGRMTSGVATDIGTGIVYCMVFLALLAADQCERTRPFSLDAVIERRKPWWGRVAEMRR